MLYSSTVVYTVASLGVTKHLACNVRPRHGESARRGEGYIYMASLLRRSSTRSAVLTASARRFSSLIPPLVDVRCFGEPSCEALRATTAEKASSACREHGLLALPAYGGIDPKLVSAAWGAVHGFFELPLEKKMELAYRDVRENVGYIKSGNEKPDPTLPEPDPKEVFQFQPGKRDLPAELEEPLSAIFAAGVLAGRSTLRCLARSLDLPDDETFARAISSLDQCSLRAVHYPGGVAPLANRCGAHTDFGLCTLLLNEHDGPPGLQAENNATGEWRHVMPPDGAQDGGVGVAFVNLGGQLERWSNDEVVATRHRVVAPADPAEAARSRFVIALFIDADTPTDLACLEHFVSESRPAKYPPMTSGDYKAMRLDYQTTVDDA